MTTVEFLKGNKSGLPSSGVNDSTVYFVEDTYELYKSVGNGLPLIKITDVMYGYNDLADLQTKNPAIEGKLYLTFENKLYTYRNNIYELLSGSTSINAENIIESTSKVFVNASERSQITSNANELSSHSNRIQTLESNISTISSTDEKVKLNSTDTSSYLEDKLDNTTIKNIGNKIVAKGLDGLTTTIAELNLLSGVTSNIQSQINALTSVGNFTTSVNAYVDLSTLTPSINDMVIVISDETQIDSPTAIYIYNGTSWIYSGKFEGGQIRDFTTNPLNLDSETIGILPKTKYEKQTASETPISDTTGNLTATNVEDALTELFTYANNLKSIANVIGSPLSTSDTSVQLNSKMQQLKVLFANYLTQKGVIAYPYNTMEEMINKVLAIPNITLEGAIKKISKLNITSPYELKIQLDEALSLSDITTTPIEFIKGATGVVHYNVGFDNGDASDFKYNDNAIFDGKMKFNNRMKNYTMTKDNSWSDVGYLFRQFIDRSEWLRLDKIINLPNEQNNKFLISHDGEYKKFNNNWLTVSSSLQTSQQFLSDGMDSLSPLLDRKITTLEPISMTIKSGILSEGEVGQVFSKTLDLNKYMDIRGLEVK